MHSGMNNLPDSTLAAYEGEIARNSIIGILLHIQFEYFPLLPGKPSDNIDIPQSMSLVYICE